MHEETAVLDIVYLRVHLRSTYWPSLCLYSVFCIIGDPDSLTFRLRFRHLLYLPESIIKRQ